MQMQWAQSHNNERTTGHTVKSCSFLGEETEALTFFFYSDSLFFFFKFW